MRNAIQNIIFMTIVLVVFLYAQDSDAAASRPIDAPIINLDKSVSTVRIDEVPANVDIPYCVDSVMYTLCVVLMDGKVVSPLIVDKKTTGV